MCSGEPLGYGGRAPWAGIGGADSSESLTLWEPSGHTLSLARAGFIGLTLLPNSNALSPGSSHWMASLSPMVSFSADPALLTTSHPPPYRKMAPGPCRFPSELSPPRTWLQMPPVLLREGPLPARAQGCPVCLSLTRNPPHFSPIPRAIPCPFHRPLALPGGTGCAGGQACPQQPAPLTMACSASPLPGHSGGPGAWGWVGVMTSGWTLKSQLSLP